MDGTTYADGAGEVLDSLATIAAEVSDGVKLNENQQVDDEEISRVLPKHDFLQVIEELLADLLSHGDHQARDLLNDHAGNKDLTICSAHIGIRLDTQCRLARDECRANTVD